MLVNRQERAMLSRPAGPCRQRDMRSAEGGLFPSSECCKTIRFSVPSTGFTSLLSMNKGSCSLTIAKSLGPKVLCVAPFTVDFTLFLSQSCRL